MPDAWKSTIGVKLLALCIPYLQAEEEIRQRSIGHELGPSQAYQLIWLGTGDQSLAEDIKQTIELRKTNDAYN